MLWSLLVSTLRPHRGLVVGVVVFQLAQSAAALLLPALNAGIIDRGVAQEDLGTVYGLGAQMLGLTLVQISCAVAAIWFSVRLAMSAGRDLRRDVFGAVGRFSGQEVARFGTATLITRSSNDVQQVQTLVLMGATMLVTAPIQSIGGVVLALQQDVVLSGVLAVAVPVLLVAVTLVVLRLVPVFAVVQERTDALNGVLREQLTGVRTIRAFVRERFERDRFARANDGLHDASLRSGRLFALLFPIVQVVLNASSVAVLLFGAARVDGGAMQVGELTAFLSYLAQILIAVTMATFVLVLLPRAAVSAGRIQEVLATVPSVVAPQDPVTAFPERGRVELRGVGFRYPGAERPVLEDVSFTAGPGTTAVIGSTGAGKTTLVNLVARLFDATEGQVLVDGVDVRRADPGALRRRLGLVPQRSYLFSGTIASNLRLGREGASEAELWAALRTAQAEEFVRALPGGLEEPVAQGGGTVSGGQRQRLAVARALVADPEVYLLDDASSALDTTTDRLLREALARDRPGATVLVVAQRVSSVEHADQIVVLDDGRVAATGTHEELRITCEVYREIVASQLPAEQPA